MNRETKRLMQRQGQVGPDGAPVARREAAQQTAQRRQREPRASFVQYFRDVRDEMRQVAWPTRPEVANYTSIVGTVLIIMIALIFGLNLGFSKAILWLYQG
ncbi:MAG TPA: preprotein translocase subunit SecE [Acidimicrobiales bacterium]|nr:preprotein translocase subunit SecE [Acidimicrobiales bacterium]